MNKVVISGRMTRDPETRTGNTTVTRFTLAVDRRVKADGQPEADFISCVAFGKTADFIDKYFHKGMKMLLEGRIQTGSYTNKEGAKVYTTDVIAESVEFAESKRTDAPTEPKEQGNNDFLSIPEGVTAELPF
jgi:single-strand DNA-binding protein